MFNHTADLGVSPFAGRMPAFRMFEWYYVGQYGQLGPLSEEQMLELVESRVIVNETYVWKVGMSEWVRAGSIPKLSQAMAPAGPPPIPAPTQVGRRRVVPMPSSPQPFASSITTNSLMSPCSRVLAGVLQLFLPGVGRMYLGYLAIGVLQFILTICTCGLFAIWSIVDGVLILVGQVPVDGYGRVLKE